MESRTNQSVSEERSINQSSRLSNQSKSKIIISITIVGLTAFVGGYFLGISNIQPLQPATENLKSYIHTTSIPTNSYQTTQPTAITAFPTITPSPPSPTPLPIPKDFTWKTFTYNDPKFGMSFEYPSFWNLKEYKYENDQQTKNIYRNITDTDLNHKYGYFSNIEILSYDAINSYQSSLLASLVSIYKARSLNGFVGSEYFIAPNSQGGSALVIPLDTRYIENKDGSLRGYSFFVFTTQNGIADHIELNLLTMILTDGKSKIVQIRIWNGESDIPFDANGDTYTKPSDFHFENTQPLPCNAGINGVTNHTIKCYINKEFYTDYDRIYRHIAENIELH